MIIDFAAEYKPGDKFPYYQCPLCSHGLRWGWTNSLDLECGRDDPFEIEPVHNPCRKFTIEFTRATSKVVCIKSVEINNWIFYLSVDNAIIAYQKGKARSGVVISRKANPISIKELVDRCEKLSLIS